MPRVASAMLVVGLLVATAAAFAVTERLKLERSPILETRLDRGIFSPVCGCESATVEIGFRLRERGRLTVTVVDANGDRVRTLMRDEPRHAGVVSVRWDGRDDVGRVVREGTYKPRVHVGRLDTELPNPMRVDTTPPAVLEFVAEPAAFSPDGDGRRDKARMSYRLSEDGRAFLSVDGRVRVRGRGAADEGGLDWHGSRLRPGAYRLVLEAVDRAGNISDPASVTVRIRYIELSRTTIRVVAGRRLSVRVTTDAESFAWRLGPRRGRSVSGVLAVRAPQRPGRYALVVEANDRRARAEVVVRAR